MRFSCLFLGLGAAIFCLFAVTPALAVGDDWRAVDPAELAMKTSAVEKDADAEALFWEVRVDDGEPGELVFTNYVRVKVFSDRGKESQSQIDLEYWRDSRIKDIAARTIKPDGTIVELNKDDIHERTIVKKSGRKLKAKSFAMPGVEPGAIVEYRWRVVYEHRSANYVALEFQRDIPVRSVTYLVRPYSGPYAESMHYSSFRMPAGVKFEKAKNGFHQVSLTNVPAYREEPRMPPEDEVRSWVLLFYSAPNASTDPDKYWNELGKRLNDLTKDEMKVKDEVRSAAKDIVGDAVTPEEKIKRIYEYCQTKIKNISRDYSLTREERAKLGKEIKSPSDTLKRGMGKGENIDALFAALATAAGFEAHLAVASDREKIFFDRKFTNPYFLEEGSSFIAVRIGDNWKFFSPAETYTPFGMLGWREEGESALIISKEPTWAQTPVSSPEKSMQKNVGRFRLLEDGTLEGDVHIEYTGQLAIDKKNYHEDESPAQREETLRDSVKARMSTAELSDIKIENVTDPVKPFVYAYHVRVPGYAQRTGKRLFLQPAFFEHGAGAVFTASNRTHPVYFHYPWAENDEIEIELPAGFALDNAEAPGPFAAQGISAYEVNIAVTTDGHKLIFKRDFFFGGGGNIYFPQNSYTQLKTLFDRLHQNDEHTITLKQATTAASSK